MRLTKSRLTTILEALLLAEERCQVEVHDLAQIEARLGLKNDVVTKHIQARVKKANSDARRFDHLRRELEVE